MWYVFFLLPFIPDQRTFVFTFFFLILKNDSKSWNPICTERHFKWTVPPSIPSLCLPLQLPLAKAEFPRSIARPQLSTALKVRHSGRHCCLSARRSLVRMTHVIMSLLSLISVDQCLCGVFFTPPNPEMSFCNEGFMHYKSTIIFHSG